MLRQGEVSIRRWLPSRAGRVGLLGTPALPATHKRLGDQASRYESREEGVRKMYRPQAGMTNADPTICMTLLTERSTGESPKHGLAQRGKCLLCKQKSPGSNPPTTAKAHLVRGRQEHPGALRPVGQ